MEDIVTTHMKLETEQCGNCFFWQPREGEEQGNCRANPPSLSIGFGSSYARFPITPKDGWCGEHHFVEGHPTYTIIDPAVNPDKPDETDKPNGVDEDDVAEPEPEPAKLELQFVFDDSLWEKFRITHIMAVPSDADRGGYPVTTLCDERIGRDDWVVLQQSEVDVFSLCARCVEVAGAATRDPRNLREYLEDLERADYERGKRSPEEKSQQYAEMFGGAQAPPHWRIPPQPQPRPLKNFFVQMQSAARRMRLSTAMGTAVAEYVDEMLKEATAAAEERIGRRLNFIESEHSVEACYAGACSIPHDVCPCKCHPRGGGGPGA